MQKSDSAPRIKAVVWWSLAALALAGGFADLVRGGDTIAPVLLALGYCVLIPVAILT
jgi:hypothetical protein